MRGDFEYCMVDLTFDWWNSLDYKIYIFDKERIIEFWEI